MKDLGSYRQPKTHSYPLWSPRFWHGMRFGHWMRLVLRNRFQFHPLRIPMAAAVSLCTPSNSILRLIQKGIYGRRIRETEIKEPPVFIIGHWRSGTTMLHEMMVQDEQFSFPNSYQCFSPHHFLLTEWFFVRFCGFLLPKHRPMDNMAAGWKLPQEDEFALMNLGAGSPYSRMAFPNRPGEEDHFLDIEQVNEVELEYWKKTLIEFVKTLTFQLGKRIILKSPPHTGRIGVLAELFPEARFIHVSRHPFAIFASSIRLWQSLDFVQGFQIPQNKGLDEYVLSCMETMYGGYNRQLAKVPSENIAQVRYEDLVADPIGHLRSAYEQLDLGDFSQVEPNLQKYCADRRDYKTNRHELLPEDEATVRDRWSFYFDQFGYE